MKRHLTMNYSLRKVTRDSLGCLTRRFTLIELLIVIAVIAILASMLLPALKKAKEQAKLALCIGNQKQLGAGLCQYSIDFDDNMPWSVLEHVYLWTIAAQNSGINPSIVARFGFDPGPKLNAAILYGKGGYVQDPHVFFCPSDTRFLPSAEASPWPKGVTYYSYNYNFHGYGINPWPYKALYPRYSKTPNTLPLFIDRVWSNSYLFHNTRWNRTFNDLHVDTKFDTLAKKYQLSPPGPNDASSSVIVWNTLSK